jgi:hypothetical protein
MMVSGKEAERTSNTTLPRTKAHDLCSWVRSLSRKDDTLFIVDGEGQNIPEETQNYNNHICTPQQTPLA